MYNFAKKISFSLLAFTFFSVDTTPILSTSIKNANKYYAKNDTIELNVYNSEDYIAEDYKDDDGNDIKGIITEFEEYERSLGKNVHVNYSCFDTNENMLAQIRIGSSDYDLICTSDYVVQKMISEGDIIPFEDDETFNSNPFSSTPNYQKYCSPFIKDKLANIPVNINGEEKYVVNQYCRGYMWGTLGLLYNSDFKKLAQRGITPEQIDEDLNSWLTLWDNSAYNKLLSIKDSMRDTYAVGIMKTYDEDFELNGINYEGFKTLKEKHDNKIYDDDTYNKKVTEIFNMCDDTTISRVEENLITLRDNAYGMEVDGGKSDMARGMYYAINLAWSGDATWAMSMADEYNDAHYERYPDDDTFNPTILKYKIPETGANIWFDAWVMPNACKKRGNQEIASEFIDFLSNPEHAVENMDYIGYTPVIAGDVLLDYVKSTCGDVRYDEENETFDDNKINDYTLVSTDDIKSLSEDELESSIYRKDISYFFKGTLEDEDESAAVFYIPASERERVFDTEYPDSEILPSLAIMNDYGEEQNKKVVKMWSRVKNRYLPTWVYIVVAIFVVLLIAFAIYSKIDHNKKIALRKERKEERQKANKI